MIKLIIIPIVVFFANSVNASYLDDLESEAINNDNTTYVASLKTTSQVPSTSSNPIKGDLIKRVTSIINNPAKLKKAQKLGEQRALLCSYCHGKDGNSVKPEIPRLAGQNAVYLLHQIKRFANKDRIQFVMNSLTKGFTEQEKVNLAVYYATSKVKPDWGDPIKAVKGAKRYHEICQQCHGVNGKGTKDFARIAGQHPTYIINTLKAFRDKKTTRTNNLMEAFTAKLTDEQIENLAAYIANLR